MPASRRCALTESLLRPSLVATFSSVGIGVRMWPVSVHDAPLLPVFKRCPGRSAFWDSLFVVVLGATVTRSTVFLMGHRTHDRSDKAFDVLAPSVWVFNTVLPLQDGFGAPSATCVSRGGCPTTP